jgi:hypothetical protein
MRPSLLALVSAAALVGACARSQTEPSSAPDDATPSFALLGNVRVPISATLTTCDGDVVTLSGVGHFYNTSAPTPNGGLHITNNVVISARGTSLSGATYLLNDSHHLILNVTSVPGEITEVEHLTLIGLGGAQNLVADALLHITVNAQGEISVSIDEVRIVCPA